MDKVIENTNSVKLPEEWKPIPGYAGKYEVSSWGRVKSNSQKSKGRILVPIQEPTGYYRVNLYKDGKVKKCAIHRLVAEVFLPNPSNLPQVNHRDEIKQNNYVENLEWCTPSYNSSYGTRMQRVKEKISKPILQLDKQGNVIKEWSSISKVSKDLSVSGRSHITDCLKGRRKTALGYMWKYADEVQHEQ